MTIGRVVAAALSARLIHNHLLHDVAIGIAGLDDPERWPLYGGGALYGRKWSDSTRRSARVP